MNIIDTIVKERQFLLKLLEDVTIDELNSVPPGFNNNIIWNLGHLIASQQGVCYLRAGLKTRIDEAFYVRFKPETKPDGLFNSEAVAEIKTLLFSTLEQFEQDYQNGIFSNYNTWTTRYGATLTNIDDALQFLLYHEGLHTGYIMALKRAVRSGAQ
jgi:hypothetical protein